MTRYIFLSLSALVLFFTLNSCQDQSSVEPEADAPASTAIHQGHIHLTAEQQAMAGIELGQAVQRPLPHHIGCTAYVDVPPYSLASVYTPVAGIVQNVRHLPGEYVKKGALLTTVQHPDIVKVQQDFVESYSQLAYLQQEAERKTSLAAEEAASTRSAEEAQAALARQEAHLKGLRAQLQLLGINADALAAGEELQTSISLRAPISGYLTQVNVNQGQLVSPTDLLYEIIDNTHKHLELSVFAKDLHLLKEHQRIEAYVPGNGSLYEAEVHLIGKRVEDKDKSIQVHGHFVDEPLNLLPGTYLQARIYTDEALAWTVPETAVTRQGAQSIVYAQSDEGFEPIQVEVETTRDSFVIIHNAEQIEGRTLVLRGAYYLQSSLEEGHSH